MKTNTPNPEPPIPDMVQALRNLAHGVFLTDTRKGE